MCLVYTPVVYCSHITQHFYAACQKKRTKHNELSYCMFTSLHQQSLRISITRVNVLSWYAFVCDKNIHHNDNNNNKTNHNINNRTFIHTLAIHHDKQLCQWLSIQRLIIRTLLCSTYTILYSTLIHDDLMILSVLKRAWAQCMQEI